MNRRTTRSKREVLERVTCRRCKHFIGVITSDGCGPILDECAGEARHMAACTMVQDMAVFQPKRVPLGLGGGRSGPLDADSGGYQSIAIRAMEDN